MSAPRKSVPLLTVADILIQTRRRCCLCYFLNGDKSQKRVQIAHIDRKRNNPAPENLVPLCLDHHDEYDSSTSQSKGITVEELRRYKEMLIKSFEGRSIEGEMAIVAEERKIPKLGTDLFYGYGILFSQVSRLLFKHDPVQINFGVNDDEYDAEAHDIIARLQDNVACLSTARICKDVFAQWFTPDLANEFDGYAEMVNDIDSEWERFKERNYVYGPVASYENK